MDDDVTIELAGDSLAAVLAVARKDQAKEVDEILRTHPGERPIVEATISRAQAEAFSRGEGWLPGSRTVEISVSVGEPPI
jgi:hypothetical protein